MVEMNEVANILRNATRKSLLILDEIGRGTSTFDGMAIAWAVVEYISNTKNLGARTLFATHYHEMTELEGSLPGVKNYCIAVREQGDTIIFLRKIMRGGADKSYGIQVARLAGVPEAVLSRATELVEELTDEEITLRAKQIAESSRGGKGKPVRRPDEVDIGQLSLFETAKDDDYIKEIQEMNLAQMTPLDALNTLYRIQAGLNNRYRA
jgi:DNA mismatch repair protein MutS